MNKINLDYLLAIQAYKDFFEMLFSAIRSVAPEIKISRSGAFVWRSYRIDEYKSFALGQYYFNIYNDSPESLKFLESFFYSGQFYTHIIESVDLREKGIFNLKKDNQMKLLEGFVKISLQKGLVWQYSGERKKWVPVDLFNGSTPEPNPKHEAKSFGQISGKFLLAIPMQDYLFSLFKKSIERLGKEVFSRKIILEQNSQWRNWDFRGYRMWICNLDGTNPGGTSEYLWRIYFEEPNNIYFERNDKPPIWISQFVINNSFLSLSKDDQIDTIDEFVKKSLESQKFQFSEFTK